MTAKRLTPKQRQAELTRVAGIAVGRKTMKRGLTIEAARVDDGLIVLTFAGWGPAPFREALFTTKEVLDMIGER